MINPINISFYDAEESKLQEFLLFCLFVANKNADRTSKVLEDFLGDSKVKPFDKLCGMFYNYQINGGMENILRRYRTGQYKRLSVALHQIWYNYEAGIKHFHDLKNISFDELYSIHGIGRKTANFFLLYTRKGYEGVVLDTHILSYLRSLGFYVPKQTPQSASRYGSIESIFLTLCKNAKLKPSVVDLEVWKLFSGRHFDKNSVPLYDRLLL